MLTIYLDFIEFKWNKNIYRYGNLINGMNGKLKRFWNNLREGQEDLKMIMLCHYSAVQNSQIENENHWTMTIWIIKK